ncbi:MAG: MATE family efflux transporter [Clostridiales bacterium]|nr:MATE family efflux transporter [Clostridiales bacterium]
MANSGATAQSEARRNFMLEGKLLSVIISIAVPSMLTMVIDSLYNMADTYFVSRLGEAAIAAVGVNDSLMNIIRAIAMGFSVGASSFISRALGANRDEDASRAAVTTLFTAAGTMAVVSVLASIFLLPVVNFMGATDTVRPYSMEYARWILVFAPITAGDTVLSQTLRAEGSTIFSMVGMTSGALINIVLDPIFINTLGLGVAGAAIATGISKVISLLVLMWPYFKKKCVIRLKPSYFSPTLEIYTEIARMGIPTMLRTGMMSVSRILINNIAAFYGDHAMASISVANKSLRVVASCIMGFGQGFQPVAGYNYGAKKYDRVLKALRYTMTIGGVSGIVLGAAMYVFAPQIIGVFSDSPGVMELGLILLRSQCITMLPHVWTMITTGLYQATGKALKAGVMGLSRELLVLIPCVLILPRLFGAVGLASAQAVSDVIAFLIAVVFLVPTLRELIALNKSVTAGILPSQIES